MQDHVLPTTFGFVEIRFRDGRAKSIATTDIKGLQSRREGGTAIRLVNDFIVLVSCPIEDVTAAMRVADGGGYVRTA